MKTDTWYLERRIYIAVGINIPIVSVGWFRPYTGMPMSCSCEEHLDPAGASSPMRIRRRAPAFSAGRCRELPIKCLGQYAACRLIPSTTRERIL